MTIGDKIRLPDDVTLGYIIEYLLKKPLTVVEQFHSHLEPMKHLKSDMIRDQISFSYSRNTEGEHNVVVLDHSFDMIKDHTRFLTIHCFLFPNFNFCHKRNTISV